MIYPETKLVVADNSGAKVVQCIGILGGTKKGYGNIGSLITITVKKALTNGKIKKSKVCQAVVVRSLTGLHRANGEVLKFEENAAVILNEKLQPVGNRIFGAIPRELIDKFPKIVSLSKIVV